VSQKKENALVKAAENGRADDVKAFIESGVNANAVDKVCCLTVFTDTLCAHVLCMYCVFCGWWNDNVLCLCSVIGLCVTVLCGAIVHSCMAMVFH